MNTPKFSAEASLYQAHRHYQAGRHLASTSGQAVIPAIPACRNCDWILDRCLANGGFPRAVCNACARGYCYDEPPIPDPLPTRNPPPHF